MAFTIQEWFEDALALWKVVRTDVVLMKVSIHFFVSSSHLLQLFTV